MKREKMEIKSVHDFKRKIVLALTETAKLMAGIN
jgi:hypothetical protein